MRFDMTREGGRIQLEMALPSRNELGIKFNTGSEVGLRIGYSNIQKDGGNASTFDKWSQVYYALGEEKAAQPKPAEQTKLLGNAPNPFRGSTTIRYQMESAEHVDITVYDLLGRPVQTLVDRKVQAGKNRRVEWSGGSASSGIYFVRLRTESGRKAVRKVVHLQ